MTSPNPMALEAKALEAAPAAWKAKRWGADDVPAYWHYGAGMPPDKDEFCVKPLYEAPVDQTRTINHQREIIKRLLEVAPSDFPKGWRDAALEAIS